MIWIALDPLPAEAEVVTISKILMAARISFGAATSSVPAQYIQDQQALKATFLNTP